LSGAATECQRRVLVVDDDASIREALADLLGDEGYRVTTATNGAEALTLLRPPGELRPCVILLDLMMPVMSGQEFYAEQQRDPALSRIPTVVISADGNVARKAAAFGAEFLSKPVRLEAMLGLLDRLCN
jgi:two-component system chemotaxis response regulator CheY